MKKRTSKAKTKAVTSKNEGDAFFLKAVLYLIIGTQWVVFEKSGFSLPYGLMIGIIFANHEHFVIDQKLEYVILLIAAFVAYWLPIGLTLSL
jgi:ABC-type dipeptide/oligopeptide/nickel transport system permease component